MAARAALCWAQATQPPAYLGEAHQVQVLGALVAHPLRRQLARQALLQDGVLRAGGQAGKPGRAKTRLGFEQL